MGWGCEREIFSLMYFCFNWIFFSNLCTLCNEWIFLKKKRMQYVEAWWVALEVHLLINLQEASGNFLQLLFIRLIQNYLDFESHRACCLHWIVGRIPICENDESRLAWWKLRVRGLSQSFPPLIIFWQPLGLCWTQLEIHWSLPGMLLI